MKKESILLSSVAELSIKVDGKGSGSGSGTDQRPNTPRSKHSATEQRRRSKINDRRVYVGCITLLVCCTLIVFLVFYVYSIVELRLYVK